MKVHVPEALTLVRVVAPVTARVPELARFPKVPVPDALTFASVEAPVTERFPNVPVPVTRELPTTWSFCVGAVVPTPRLLVETLRAAKVPVPEALTLDSVVAPVTESVPRLARLPNVPVPLTVELPTTCSLWAGAVVPIPTLPGFVIVSRSVNDVPTAPPIEMLAVCLDTLKVEDAKELEITHRVIPPVNIPKP